MMNMVMLVKDRPRLTLQALSSLRMHSSTAWSLVIVDDGSEKMTNDIVTMFATAYPKRTMLVRIAPDRGIAGVLGALKNLGVKMSDETYDREDWLYLSDNDVYFTDGWDLRLQAVARVYEKEGFRLFGGGNHPYHRPMNKPSSPFHEYMAVAGTSWLMRWSTWDTYGPLNADAKGTGQSEDSAFCARIRADGYRVGAMEPPLVLDTGITQTDGSPSVGADLKRRIAGVQFL